jgi:hypothetical protein
MYNPLPNRPYVGKTEQVMRLIAPGHCWHFDAWLLAGGDKLFLLVETRAGGRQLLTLNMYQWDGGRLHYCTEGFDDLQPVTLQDKALWPRFDELNALHWRYVYPMSLRVPPGFRSRSVALHYIRAPSLEPFDGTEVNLHQYDMN